MPSGKIEDQLSAIFCSFDTRLILSAMWKS